MNSLVKSVFVLLSVVILFFATGCKSSKSTLSTTATYPIVTEGNDDVTKLLSNFEQTIASYQDWTDVVMPMNLSLIAPKQLSISGRTTMVKDESIYISIRVLGFEAANAYITNDSIFASYKLDKIYIAEDLRKILGGFPATISDLQSMLLGRAFVLGKGAINSTMNNEFLLSINEDSWKITPHDINNVGYEFIFENSTNSLSTLSINIANENRANCIYGGSTSTAVGNIAKGVTISTEIKDTPLCAKIAWELNNAKWNTAPTTKWKTPKGYRRINVANILKSL
ncbi:MAG: DUF4292 domain-containing protein [Muribaculaceae bacterium]|nr:DUF4292 domain-containing protein [Muribaculaceae bacterium]